MGAEAGPAPSLPSRHTLRAALEVGRLVDETETTPGRLRAAYRNVPTDGLYDVDDLRRGEAVLRRAGLLGVAEDGDLRGHPRLAVLRTLEPPEALRVLLTLWVHASPPPWLRVAVGRGELHLPYIPDRARRTLEGLFPEEKLRRGVLAGLGPHPATDGRRELGRRGEAAAVAACRRQRRAAGHPGLADRVQRVSRISDAFGYDVSAPRSGRDTVALHLEVKTTVRTEGPLRLHLSRHQARVGRHDPAWRLVVCAPEDGTIEVTGWCTFEMLSDALPRDREGRDDVAGRWEAAEIRITRKGLRRGLPPLT